MPNVWVNETVHRTLKQEKQSKEVSYSEIADRHHRSHKLLIKALKEGDLPEEYARRYYTDVLGHEEVLL